MIPRSGAAQGAPAGAGLDDVASATVDGTVDTSAARWNEDGTRILTESIIRTAEGSRIRVRQPGGTVDGVAMRVIPSPPNLRPGDRVTATTRRGWIVEASVRRALPRRAADSKSSTMEFVRTTNKIGAELYWKSGCVYVAYDIDGTSHISGTGEFDVMDAVFARWRTDAQSCSYLTVERDTPKDSEVGFDGRNVVLFREDKWCRPASKDEPEECHSPSAAALTTLFFIEDEESDRNGEILDADIEFNAVDFAISVNGDSASPVNCKSDLANTFTHEVGHLFGLDHTCWDGRGTVPRDQNGSPVPTCTSGAVSDAARQATMYAFQECGETKKATLEQDDIDGLCGIYPLADDPKQCKRADLGGGGCCSVGPTPTLPPLGTLLLFALVAGALRRRGRGTRAPLRA